MKSTICIKRYGSKVVTPYFKSRVNSALLPCLLQQSRQQTFAMASTPYGRVNGNRRDVQLISDKPATGHTQQGLGFGPAKA